MKTTTINKKKTFSYLHFSDVVTLSCDNTLIFMYFMQDLLENWILGVNLVVDKTLRKLCKPTTSRDNDVCNCCLLLLVEQGKGNTIQSLSADQRGQDRAKIRTIKKQRRKRVGKRVAYHLVSEVESSRMSLALNVVVQSPPQWGWVKMAGQISRGARPKGRPHCLGLFFRWAAR